MIDIELQRTRSAMAESVTLPIATWLEVLDELEALRQVEPVKQEPVLFDKWDVDEAKSLLPAMRQGVALLEYVAGVLPKSTEPVKQEPVAQQDSDDKRLLREIFMLCEATEELEPTNDFMRGRIFEAKGIRRGIGNWYQDTFCGRSYMGEPVLNAAPVQQVDLDAMVNRFLGWRLPIDFWPDCGIEFHRIGKPGQTNYGRFAYEPVGTNLFTADQAKAMFEYCLSGNLEQEESGV